jgi:hydrogenase expression/formation protein HypC
MCLAVPGKVIECRGDEALIDLQGNTLRVSKVLTPEVRVGSWVLVHAGFAIRERGEREALETWDSLRQALGDEVIGGAAGDSPASDPAAPQRVAGDDLGGRGGKE